MTEPRSTWDDYFLEIAATIATRATCPRKHVGTVLVKNKTILSTGYNGSISGVPHCSEVGCMMEDSHCVATIHAELNAVTQAAKNGVSIDGAECYVTASPCWNCFKVLANAGIKRIVYKEFYRDERIFKIAKDLGIEMVSPSGNQQVAKIVQAQAASAYPYMALVDVVEPVHLIDPDAQAYARMDLGDRVKSMVPISTEQDVLLVNLLADLADAIVGSPKDTQALFERFQKKSNSKLLSKAASALAGSVIHAMVRGDVETWQVLGQAFSELQLLSTDEACSLAAAALGHSLRNRNLPGE